jgi:ubiquinol-cytochrome c reductase iron-sulfur subunit
MSAPDPTPRPEATGATSPGPEPDDRDRVVAALFLVAAAASLGLAVVYVSGGQAQWEGALLAVALGCIGAALAVWSKRILGHVEHAEERHPLRSERESREEFLASLERSQDLGRTRLLRRSVLAAAGSLAVALVFPLRSLGPSPGRALFRTRWQAGKRVTLDDGRPLRPEDVEVGGIVTVFPEGTERAEDSATLLLRVDPQLLALRPDRMAWTVDGLVAYLKICTHVGCPVGLYRESTHELLCPCHQSTFDVLHGARPVFGPATRALPQLPLAVDGEGHLVATGDFPEPVGPGFWNR